MDEVINSIISGASGGAIAGLVVTLILASYRQVDAKLRRREQISHIRTIIAVERANIYAILEFDSLPGGIEIDSNSARYAHFEYLRRELELALDGRSSEITFNEIRQIRRVFIRHDLIRNAVPDRLPEGLTFYNGIFQSLEEIEWLKLPRVETETP